MANQFLFQDMENIITVEYEDKYADKVAEMWMASDVDWPGGFTGGKKLTGKDIIEAYNKTRCPSRFLLFDNKKSKVVAVLEAVEIPNNKYGVYIGLNVHPDYRGAAIILLADVWTKTIDKLVEKKYRYMLMETWPTNEPVIILAKRSGFYWRPNTAVRMENYFPLLMRIPIVIKFFTKYDIVECQYEQAAKRDTSIKEDKILWNGIYVYPYEWQKKDEYVKVYVDIYSHNITGVENQDFLLYCYPKDSNIAYAGKTKEIEWVFKNKKNEPVNVSFEITADSDINIVKPIPYKAVLDMPIGDKMKWGYDLRRPYSYKVSPQQEIKFTREASINNYAKEIDENYYPLHRIYSNVYVEGELINLETALKIKQPIRITHYPKYITLRENIEKEIILNIENQTNNTLKGKLVISYENLEVKIENEEFELKGVSKIGIPIKVKAKNYGIYKLEVSPIINELITTTHTIYINCTGIDEISAYQTNEELVMENENLILTINLKNGRMNIYDKFLQTQYLTQSFDELGPPFIMQGFENTFDKEKEFNVRIEKENNKIKGIIETSYTKYKGYRFITNEKIIGDEIIFPDEYINYEGINIIKEVTISASSVIKIQYKFYNTTPLEYKFQLRVRTKSMRSDATIYLPTKEGIIKEQIITREFPIIGRDLSDNPQDYTQSWSAFEIDNLVYGLMWKDATLCEYGIDKMPDLIFDIHLKPATTFNLSPIYIYCGVGNYEIIKYYYEKIFEHKERYYKVDVIPLLRLATKPIILIDNETEFDLNLRNTRNKPVVGNLKLNPEQGFNLNETEFFAEITQNQPFIKKLKLNTSKKELGVYKIDVVFNTELREYNFQLPIIIAGDKNEKIAINTKRENNMEIIEIDNKYILLKVCPEFAGSVIALQKDNKNHLISSFPYKIAFSWLSPWAGGIQPFFMKQLSFPTKLYEEEFTYELVKNNSWQGIKLITELKNLEYKGVRVSISYLTLPASNIIAILQEVDNPTTYFNELFIGLGIFLQLGGDEEQDTILYFKRDDKLIHRRKTIYDAWVGTDVFAAVENKKTNDIIGIINQSKEARIICADFGLIGKHLFIGTQLKLTPKEKKYFISFLLIKDSINNLLKYEILKEGINQSITAQNIGK